MSEENENKSQVAMHTGPFMGCEGAFGAARGALALNVKHPWPYQRYDAPWQRPSEDHSRRNCYPVAGHDPDLCVFASLATTAC